VNKQLLENLARERRERLVKLVKIIISVFAAIMVIFSTSSVYANNKEADEESEKIFQALDKNKDGKISKEEWNSIDVNKDGEITTEEWQKYHFKSSRNIKWIDNNGDILMDKDEFMNNFK
jgi:Ca2+-binding EF-hand superfamily protein